MSIITRTPMGMVESGADFHGNVPPLISTQIETGNNFQGNSPISTPSPVVVASNPSNQNS